MGATPDLLSKINEQQATLHRVQVIHGRNEIQYVFKRVNEPRRYYIPLGIVLNISNRALGAIEVRYSILLAVMLQAIVHTYHKSGLETGIREIVGAVLPSSKVFLIETIVSVIGTDCSGWTLSIPFFNSTDISTLILTTAHCVNELVSWEGWDKPCTHFPLEGGPTLDLEGYEADYTRATKAVHTKEYLLWESGSGRN